MSSGEKSIYVWGGQEEWGQCAVERGLPGIFASETDEGEGEGPGAGINGQLNNSAYSCDTLRFAFGLHLPLGRFERARSQDLRVS